MVGKIDMHQIPFLQISQAVVTEKERLRLKIDEFRNHMSDMQQRVSHIQQIQGEIVHLGTTIQNDQVSISQQGNYLAIQQQMNDQLILSILQEQEKIEEKTHEINQVRDKAAPEEVEIHLEELERKLDGVNQKCREINPLIINLKPSQEAIHQQLNEIAQKGVAVDHLARGIHQDQQNLEQKLTGMEQKRENIQQEALKVQQLQEPLKQELKEIGQQHLRIDQKAQVILQDQNEIEQKLEGVEQKRDDIREKVHLIQLNQKELQDYLDERFLQEQPWNKIDQEHGHVNKINKIWLAFIDKVAALGALISKEAATSLPKLITLVKNALTDPKTLIALGAFTYLSRNNKLRLIDIALAGCIFYIFKK